MALERQFSFAFCLPVVTKNSTPAVFIHAYFEFHWTLPITSESHHALLDTLIYVYTTLTPDAALFLFLKISLSHVLCGSDEAAHSKIRSNGAKHLSAFIDTVSLCRTFLKWTQVENLSPSPPAGVCNQSVGISRVPQVTYAGLPSPGHQLSSPT